MTPVRVPMTDEAAVVKTPRIKVCGITTPHDAVIAESAGADAIGLIFASRSKRSVTLEQAAGIVQAVGPLMTKVGVFVDADIGLVERYVADLRLDAVQLHGSETPAYAAALAPRVKVIRALPFSRAPTPAAVDDYPADAFLLDAATPGSGTVFDWSKALAWRAHPRLVLAGGLTPDNVAAAVAILQPYAVDVASGVESGPGVKNAEAVKRFVQAARSVAV